MSEQPGPPIAGCCIFGVVGLGKDLLLVTGRWRWAALCGILRRLGHDAGSVRRMTRQHAEVPHHVESRWGHRGAKTHQQVLGVEYETTASVLPRVLERRRNATGASGAAEPARAEVGAHSCALDSDGVATCWGSDMRGETDVPREVLFLQLGGNSGYTCGLRAADGRAQCWGATPLGQAREVPADGTFDALAVGSSSVCAIRKQDAFVQCWGALWGSEVTIP